MDGGQAPARRRRKMQRITMTDVARRADVSPSTVSLYLRKPDAVSPEAGRAIAGAIEALGYVPNAVAGGLAAASSRVVSVVIPSLRNAFFAETVTVLQTVLAEAGLHLLIGHTEYSERQEEALVHTALSWAPAAVVLTGLAHGKTTRAMLRGSAVPVVEMWELGDTPPIDMAVGFSHHEVGVTTCNHLLQHGRRRIAFLGARLQDDRRAARRAAGFAAAAAEAGIEDALVLDHPAPATAEAGALLLTRALHQMPGLDAVACSNDLLALGVLFECQRRGIAVPRDLAVIGFGDLGFSASCIPPLTTVRPFGEIIGKEVARLVLDRIADPDGARTPQVVDTGHLLIVRSST